MPAPQHPDPLLEVRCELLDVSPTLTAWCAGYELGEWRAKQLAKHVLAWLPEFALRYGEWQDLKAHNAIALIARAAESIYKSPKYASRGEFGEILLHIMIRQRFKSVPAISKYFYKDSSNDTVKGFDAVHVVGDESGWELWLGEVKFYSDIDQAITDVVAELAAHTQRDYLRGEFAAITNKLDDRWGGAAGLRRLLHESTSLDHIFKRICIPVLLTYDSDAVGGHDAVTAAYQRALEAEVTKLRERFAARKLPTNVSIRLFLFPMRDKAQLVQLMDKALKQCQSAL